MSALRYPNESEEYRRERDKLLQEEQKLIDQVRGVDAASLLILGYHKLSGALRHGTSSFKFPIIEQPPLFESCSAICNN